MYRIDVVGRMLFAVGLTAVVAAFSLAGCQTTQPGQGELFLSSAEIAAKDDAICQSYGARPGSPEYINCRGQQDQRRTAWKASN
jgi:hypothetical protein